MTNRGDTGGQGVSGQRRGNGGPRGGLRLLGAVLAGGRSRRFGSDKAIALLEGRALLDWAADALSGRVGQIVFCGRAGGLTDRPGPDLGPLGGINAALHFGRANGFDAVLSVPCDVPRLADDTLDRVIAAGTAAYLLACPVVGLWPCALADLLDTHLAGEDRSMRGWATRVGAVAVEGGSGLINVNTIDDLRRAAESAQ